MADTTDKSLAEFSDDLADEALDRRDPPSGFGFSGGRCNCGKMSLRPED